jgi:hypothetical protein
MRLATASNYKYTMMVSQKLRDKVCVLCKAKANIRSWMIVTPLRSALFRISGQVVREMPVGKLVDV